MKNMVKVTLLASAMFMGGFAGVAQAEGEWVNDYPRVTSNNIVGGGPVRIVNTGNSNMPTEARALDTTPLANPAEAGRSRQAGYRPIAIGSQSVGG